MNFTYLKPAAQNANRQLGGRTENWEAIATQFTQEKGPKWWDNPTAPFNVGNTKSNGKTFDEFPSLDAGVNGYVNFLMNDPAGYYAEVRKAIREGTPNDVLVALSKCPYCSPPYPLTELEGVYQELFGAVAQPKEATNVSYPKIDVKVMGHPFDAIAVNNETRVLYTALDFLQTPYHLDIVDGHYTGLININGVDVQCTQYNGTTYVPWASLAKGIQAVHDGTGWNFIVDAPPAPTEKVLATWKIDVMNDGFYLDVPVKVANPQTQAIGKMQFDTGAFEPLICKEIADAIGLPNQGQENINGVGGSVVAYASTLTVVIGDKTYDMPCVVDPQWDVMSGSIGLFGMKGLIDNHIGININPDAGTIVLYDTK